MNSGYATVFVYIFDRKSSASTEDMLRTALQAYCESVGCGPLSEAQLELARTPKGKPYLPNASHIHVSASHSEDYFACAVSGEHVGIDIQLHTRRKNETAEAARLMKIARRFFHPREAAYVEADTCSRFFRVWTAKESYVKLTGQGIDGHFGDFSVIPPNAPGLPEWDPRTDFVTWRAADVCFAQREFAGDYSLCVCAPGDGIVGDGFLSRIDC